MNKDETTKAIERTGHKILAGQTKHPSDNSLMEEKKNEPEVNKLKEAQKPATEKTEEKPKVEVKKKEMPKVKRIIARVNARDIPISTKKSSDVCRFIKGKKIKTAVHELEEILAFKRPLPMRGEIPHRKGKIMSGRYPQKVIKNFIVLLKSLGANAVDLDDPVITEAFANTGSRPYGRFGRTRKKRTHITLVARDAKKQDKKIGGKK
ncbi:hypothetical protein HYT23_03075 [Candidatus Pacearchaeota archaeon]|nr:hypothetical protein [Candidatus Pacearchaeota archaeon]